MSKKCEACSGTGERYSNSVFNSLNPLYTDGMIPCEYCNGTGEQPDKIQFGKYQCENGLDNPDNQQSTNEEIRQAFEKTQGRISEHIKFRVETDEDERYEYVYYVDWESGNLSPSFQDEADRLTIAYAYFYSGYKSRDKSAQAEIENIKEWNIKIVKKKDEEIRQLKTELEKLKNKNAIMSGKLHIISVVMDTAK